MTTATGHTEAIPASRVIGTNVYNTAGDKIGDIQDVMLEKTSNGIIGIGEKYHAIPWASLDYDKDKDGYVVPYDKEQLRAAPSYSINELTEQDGLRARDDSYSYYKVDPYWQ